MRDTRLSATMPPQPRPGAPPAATQLLRLELDDVPEFERPARLREFFQPRGVRYEAARIGDDPVEIDLKLHVLPGVQLLSARMQGTRYRRVRESNDPAEDVGLVLNSVGTHHIAQLGREVTLTDGEAAFVSLTDTLVATHHAPTTMRVLRVPKAALAPRLAGGQDGFLRRIPRDASALALLGNYVAMAWQEQTLADHALQHLVVSHFYDLIAVTIGATRDAAEAARGRGLSAARLHAIKQDIVRHLDGPDLSVSAVAGRHHCTERLVQRLFEMEGTTFTDYVLTQRLARAYRRLSDPHRDGEKISALAYDCGFNDVSYFNRVFRRLYGATPSDVRAEARQAARGDAVPHDS